MPHTPNPLRGPGSNQHRDKPPSPPRPPADGTVPTPSGDAFLADPFGDASAAAVEVPKWMLGGDPSHPHVADRARHEQRTCEVDATRASAEGDTLGITIADHWASIYRDFAVHHADDIEKLLVRAHEHARSGDGTLRDYPSMLNAAGIDQESVSPTDWSAGDVVLTTEPVSRADCVALVMTRGERPDGVETATLVAVTPEGFTSAFRTAIKDLPDATVRISQ